MNNEITEEQTKSIIERYGEDAWCAVAAMTYPQLVEFYLSLRCYQKSLTEEADDSKARLKEFSERLDWLEDMMEEYEYVSDHVSRMRYDYNEKFNSIKEDRAHKEIGNGRAAKVARAEK